MPNLYDEISEKRAALQDPVTVPLLGSYGAVPGLSKRSIHNGRKSAVMVVEFGGKRVMVTDAKNAHEILTSSKGSAKGRKGKAPEGQQGDKLALVVADDSAAEGVTVTPLEQPNDSATAKESYDQKLVREFVQFIQSLRFGETAEGDKPSQWRDRAPVIITACLLLMTMLTMLIWTLVFRGGFGFETPTILFNFHPFLMITGFIFFSGYAMLCYRGLSWLDKSTVKILHATFHFMALVSVLLGFLAIKNSITLQFPDRPQFVTLHSWLGLITISLMGKQYVSAFLAFIVGYYRYKEQTESLRAKLVPLHSTVGLITFVMAAATAVAGLTEKAIFSLSDMYILFTAEEAPYINAVGLLIVASTIAMVFTLKSDRTKQSNKPQIYFVDNVD